MSFRWPRFLIWYFAYVLLAAFAPEFMATKVWGNINVGLLLGLAQFVTTFAITGWYVWYANRKLDPIAAEIRDELEAPRVRQAWNQISGVSEMTLMVPAVNVADLEDNPLLNIGIFALFVAITLFIVIRASRNNTTAADFFTAGRAFTGPQNGIAISGDYLSAAASSASQAPSPSTATTASCTRSASWSPGSSRCCWSPNCCATQANSRWPTC